MKVGGPVPSSIRSWAFTGQLPAGLAQTSPASAEALRKKPWSAAITTSSKPSARSLYTATRICFSVLGIRLYTVSGLLSRWLSISVDLRTRKSTALPILGLPVTKP